MSHAGNTICELCGEEAQGESPHLSCMQLEQARDDVATSHSSYPSLEGPTSPRTASASPDCNYPNYPYASHDLYAFYTMGDTVEKQITADSLFVSLGCQEEVTRDFIAVALQDIILFDKKQHDRGPENIARHGEKGVVLRLWDKLARINRIVWDGVQPMVSESVEQEFADLSVYGVIARLCLAGRWPQIGRQPEGRCSACQQRYEYEHPAHPG